jgi:uncharacterized protein involved in response to NO
MTSAPKPQISTSNPDPGGLQEGRLFGLLVAAYYVLFTLLPDSSSLMVSWPWVFVWQVGLSTCVLWVSWILLYQRRFPKLGNGLDWIAGLTVLGLIVSTLFAEFSNQARWYGWAALSGICALYALSSWLRLKERRLDLMLCQGYLSLAFMGLSWLLWISQTVLPELAKLNTLRQQGINASYDLSVLELRNWAPVGHQNYVAGYLLLALPLLCGLSYLQNGWRRWLWLSGVGLAVLTLYTTNSRGGWLGLMVLAIAAVIGFLRFGGLPRRWVGLGGLAVLTTLAIVAITDNRLRSLLTLGNAQGGEVAFRLITNVTGWNMGAARAWTGAGPGAVPLMYQRFRPSWAGREAELVYQLHSTPAQLWAELGIWGIVPAILLVLLLTALGWRWLQRVSRHRSAISLSDQVFVIVIYGALLSYGVFSLSDYQLDNICIFGTLVLYGACLTAILREVLVARELKTPPRHLFPQALGWVGLSVLVSMVVWLAPIHQAWNLSSQGFAALQQKQPDLDKFTQRLSKASSLAPWEPYYLYQLGWNLANQGFKTVNAEEREDLLENARIRFEQANYVSPYQEYGQSNLGWLRLGFNPIAASLSFAQAAQLMPAKYGVLYGLGLSLLGQGKGDLALDAFSLEALRDPMLIANPIWQSPQLRLVYLPLLDKLSSRYQELLKEHSKAEPLSDLLRQARAGMLWWQGKYAAAKQDLDALNPKDPLTTHPTLTYLLHEAQPALFGSQPMNFTQLDGTNTAQLSTVANQVHPIQLLSQAFRFPQVRSEALRQAWLKGLKAPLAPELEQELVAGIRKSSSLEQWLKQNGPLRQYRRSRTGFGVLSRHIDGPAPDDFAVVTENILLTGFLSELFPSPRYQPELDQALQGWRDALIKAVQDLQPKPNQPASIN